jgi:hypothetical protein
MRYVVACVIGLVGCGDRGPEEPPKGPDITAIPAGKGWGCFRDSVNDISICARPDRCEPMRQSIAAEYDRAKLSYSLSPCAAREKASCFTYKATTISGTIAFCAEFSSECEEFRASIARSTSGDYSDVSGRCGVYP